MSQKNVAAVLLAVAAVLGGPPAVKYSQEVNEQVVASVEIEGPSEAVVGQLIVLNLSGSRGSWLAPTGDHYVVADDTLVVSFREDGTYEVIASANAGGVGSIVRHVIEVKSPSDADDVEPAPSILVPTPAPVPVVIVDEKCFTGDVVAWCEEYNAPRDTARKIGNNFIKAATDSSDIDSLLSTVAKLNRKTNQKGVERVLALIQQSLFDNLAGKDYETHRCAFDEIGQGFLSYAGTSGSPRK